MISESKVELKDERLALPAFLPAPCSYNLNRRREIKPAATDTKFSIQRIR